MTPRKIYSLSEIIRIQPLTLTAAHTTKRGNKALRSRQLTSPVISQKFVGGKQHVPSVVKILLVKELRDVGLCRLMNDGGLDIDLLKEDKAGETVKHVVEVATKAPINAEPNFIDFNLSFSSIS